MCDLSIIVPAYNSEKTIERCIVGCLSQIGLRIELIVVDDGSSDSTTEVIRSLADARSQIRVISVQNGGPSRARNTGIQAATGSYIAFCDADDWLDKDVLNKVLSYANDTDSSIAVFGYRNIRKNKTIPHAFRRHRVVQASEFASAVLLDSRVSGFIWNKVYKKDVLAEVRMDESLSVCEDMDFNLRLALKYPEMKVCYVPGVLYNYDLRGSESLTRGHDSYESVRSVIERCLGIPALSKSAEAALYSAAVKRIAVGLEGHAAGDLAYSRSYWLNGRCPAVDKVKCLIRLVASRLFNQCK